MLSRFQQAHFHHHSCLQKNSTYFPQNTGVYVLSCLFVLQVDCSLDTAAAARVSAFLRAQTDAQFIVVSHKPQAWPCKPG